MKYQKFLRLFPQVKKQISLANYSSFHIGGRADLVLEVSVKRDFITALKLAQEENIPYFLLGGGNNVLFPDEGIKGLVIINRCSDLNIDGEYLKADSGVMLARLIKEAVAHNLSGLENLLGLPGTVGGAVFGNAGAFGMEIGNYVQTVHYLDEKGQEQLAAKKDLAFSYRDSFFKAQARLGKKIAILDVTCHLKETPSDVIKVNLASIKGKRIEKQPSGFSGGSFFKNPLSSSKSAGCLIEQTGLKGFRFGDAQISTKHANFLINTGHASAHDVIMLAEKIKQEVNKKFGVELEEEVIIIRNNELSPRD